MDYKKLKEDIKLVKELKGTYDSDCGEFYNALDNILEFAQQQVSQLEPPVMRKIMDTINETIETERHLILQVLPSGLTERYEHRYATDVLTKLKKKIVEQIDEG